jgi:hypothetical protein
MSSEIREKRESTSPRRQWLRSVTRWAVLGAVGGLAAVLIARRPKRGESNECRRDLPCRRCASLARCQLPRGRNARFELSRSPTN